jgi:hypothetical protein
VVSYRPTDDVHLTGVPNTQRALTGVTCTNAPPPGLANTLPAGSARGARRHTSATDLNSFV